MALAIYDDSGRPLDMAERGMEFDEEKGIYVHSSGRYLMNGNELIPITTGKLSKTNRRILQSMVICLFGMIHFRDCVISIENDCEGITPKRLLLSLSREVFIGLVDLKMFCDVATKVVCLHMHTVPVGDFCLREIYIMAHEYLQCIAYHILSESTLNSGDPETVANTVLPMLVQKCSSCLQKKDSICGDNTNGVNILNGLCLLDMMTPLQKKNGDYLPPFANFDVP